MSDKIALALLVFYAIPMISKLMEFDNSRTLLLYKILSSTRIFPLTYGPLMYLYIKTQTALKPIFEKKYLLHFLPFILFFVISFIIPANPPRPQFNGILERNTGFPAPTPEAQAFYDEFRVIFPHIDQSMPLNQESESVKSNPKLNAADYIFLILLYSSLILYTFLIMRIFYKRNTLNMYGKLNYVWLKILTLSFVLSYSFILFFFFIPDSMQSYIFNDRIMHELSITCFVFIFCSISFKQSYIYKFDKEADTVRNDSRKYKKSGLKGKTANKIIADLEKYMFEEKPYLNCDLTIDDVSQRLGIPRYYLTQVINEKLNKNFSTYINEYRIEEAKHMLSDRNKYFTVLDIAYESGFNSKSTFNLVFKKITGITPSQFKKHFSYRSPENKLTANDISPSLLHGGE